VSALGDLARLLAIIDASGVAERIEALLLGVDISSGPTVDA
jgi:hypothetical protein